MPSTPSSPSSINVMATLLNGVAKAAVTGGDAAVEAYLTAQFPVLASPILSTLLDGLVSWLGSFLSVDLQNLVTILVIDVQTNGEKSAVYQAALAVVAANKTGDPVAIQTATTNLISAWQGLIQWDGSASAT